MIQFLKLILFPEQKAREGKKMKDLQDQISIMRLKILALEQENIALKSAVQDLSTCVSQIAYSVSDLCHEAIKSNEQDKILDDFLKINKDDDGYLN